MLKKSWILVLLSRLLLFFAFQTRLREAQKNEKRWHWGKKSWRSGLGGKIKEASGAKKRTRRRNLFREEEEEENENDEKKHVFIGFGKRKRFIEPRGEIERLSFGLVAGASLF